MHSSVYVFVHRVLARYDLSGWDVLEVGSYDVNGSVADMVKHRGTASYLGVDIEEGRGVDEICSVDELQTTYGSDHFDMVLATELLEHVSDWRSAVRNLQAVVQPGGLLLLTTRSVGMPYHGYPDDHWRYDLDDMRAIFADWTILHLENDPDEHNPGVLFLGRKSGAKVDLDQIRIVSMETGGRGGS
jgi:SAM-dependent methyltransferase